MWGQHTLLCSHKQKPSCDAPGDLIWDMWARRTYEGLLPTSFTQPWQGLLTISKTFCYYPRDTQWLNQFIFFFSYQNQIAYISYSCVFLSCLVLMRWCHGDPLNRGILPPIRMSLVCMCSTLTVDSRSLARWYFGSCSINWTIFILLQCSIENPFFDCIK